MKVLSGSIQHVTAPILRHLATSGSGWVLMACTTSATSVNLITKWNKNHITTTTEDGLIVNCEQWLWMLPYPGVTKITRSLLPLADNLACSRLWLDKVLVSDSCKTNTKQLQKITFYPLQEKQVTKNLSGKFENFPLRFFNLNRKSAIFLFFTKPCPRKVKKCLSPSSENVQDFVKKFC